MTVIMIIIAVVAVITAYGWGYLVGKYTSDEEYGDIRKVFERGLSKIDKLENYKRQLKNVSNTEDLDTLFNMAIRLVACGVDPKDIITIDRIGMAVAEGKFNQDKEKISE